VIVEVILRQFYIKEDTGLTIPQAEAEFGVEVRSLNDHGSDKLYAGRPISIEGEHDAVYRLFDRLCPGELTEEQRRTINGSV
jgi:hypothetical protein